MESGLIMSRAQKLSLTRLSLSRSLTALVTKVLLVRAEALLALEKSVGR